MSSSQSATAARSIIYLGMDAHKDSITIATLPGGARRPTRIERLPSDLPKLKRFLDRLGRDGELRACYEASGAGYVFERPTQLAAYLGLVSREDSSGDRERKGSITKAGNSHCRHVLIQAAWSDHHRPAISMDLKRRQADQPPAVIAHAWKAQHRLHQRYHHLVYRKQPQIAVVAVARELVGFLWAVMPDCSSSASLEVAA